MLENVNNFLTEIIDEDIKNGLSERIHTRFPPEPNGYLHIGSAKAIFINWSIAKKFNGLFNLRYDDTNPVKEDTEYVDSIWEDIKWLTGEEPSGGVYYGSDYFETCFNCAVQLIKDGKAYVDDLTQEEMRQYRGSLTEPGKPSPYRDRSVEENLQLFQDMRDGKFADGSKTLRAKIDMASPNMNLRDPAIYRIVRAHHHRQGDKWCIYPLYDFAHPIQDALEGITHSMCSIEFENHRPLYEWVVDNCPLPHHPKQREFARLNVTHTVMSKRYLRQLVFEKHVEGWDDPRMPTLCALRRRGYTPSAILDFVQRAGIAKANSLVDIKLLEHCIREELNETALRRMAVTEPVKLVITNYPEGQIEQMTMENNPEDASAGERQVPFGRTLYIEREDFMETPVKKFFRMTPGKEVRLKGAYIVKCEDVVKDAHGDIEEIHCTVDFDTRSGTPGADRKVKGTLHWVAADTAVDVESRLYDYLIPPDDTDDGRDFMEKVNTHSLEIKHSKAEPEIKKYKVGDRFQFLRKGYFIIDKDSSEDHLVCNRIVGLRDTWAKLAKKNG